ncbi:hypothetical protein M5K25_017722 [Dendrobium thyrsiflorum]|uniref:Syntaxin N-terminal domain-containing protein n=1 Tax=Dendrobium thyrsiflorum TaxID=117978 RepID=A0ABD0UNS2_DENTH
MKKRRAGSRARARLSRRLPSLAAAYEEGDDWLDRKSSGEEAAGLRRCEGFAACWKRGFDDFVDYKRWLQLKQRRNRKFILFPSLNQIQESPTLALAEILPPQTSPNFSSISPHFQKKFHKQVFSPWMADPELDSSFVYNEQGFIDILRSPFFDLNPEVDNSVEKYVERIIFTISNAVEEQLHHPVANHRQVKHKTRLHIGQLVKDTSAKLKEASETNHHAEVSQSKKIADAKLAKDFQAVLKEFQNVQKLAAERETAYTPFIRQAVLPSRSESFAFNVGSSQA